MLLVTIKRCVYIDSANSKITILYYFSLQFCEKIISSSFHILYIHIYFNEDGIIKIYRNKYCGENIKDSNS